MTTSAHPLICGICGKPVRAGELHHTPTGTHYDCKFPAGGTRAHTLEQLGEQARSTLAEFGSKPRARRARLGTGGPTRRLMDVIRVSAEEHFEGTPISDIQVYLPPPVWRQARFDVPRVTGSMLVGRTRVSFGSWSTVSELIRHRRVFFQGASADLDMNPVLSTRRTRKKALA